MKIVNITMQAVNNYGSVLQTLATERIFQDLGYEVETLDYIQENLQMDSVWKVVKYGGPGWKIKCKQVIMLFFKRKKNHRAEVMEEFRKKYLHLSKRYLCVSELEANFPEADIYCTGSDQTWNTVINGVSKAYFLGFVPDAKKRIAFSASFGIDKLPAKDKSEVKKLLSRYDAISVRESSGLDILEDLGIKNATLVLDPTLTVNPALWKGLASSRLIDGDYIFVYELNTSSNFVLYVNHFAEDKKLKIVYVKSRRCQDFKNAIYMDSPTIEEWLSLFKYANYIITDSFHATAFSIIFHKEFFVMYPPNFSTRLDSILNMLNLMWRRVSGNETKVCRTIDYESVDKLLNIERNKTLTFLSKNLQ